MNWHRFTLASMLCMSAILPMTPSRAAQTRLAPCVSAVKSESGAPDLGSAGCLDRSQAIANHPFESTPIVHTLVDPENHFFQLFNNSDRDIYMLHLFPRSSSGDVEVYGGVRQLSPGYAWSVNLSQGCDYDLLVEYEDGTQRYYEGVDTCSSNGIQLR